MSRFHTLLNRAYREIITEQDQPPVPAEGTPEQKTPTPVPNVPEPQPAAPVEPLTSEGETMMVRLLAKALMIDVTDDIDELTIKELGAINPKNAKQVLSTKLVPIIRKYDPTVNDVLQVDDMMDLKI
jgi:hypothetical protein